MKLLLTGAKGMLAAEIIEILKNQRSTLGQLSESYKDVELVFTDCEELDITDLGQVLAFVQKNKPDVVINCAAFTNVDLCETEVNMATKVNSLGPRNLAMACNLAGAKLMHVSTDYVFAGDAKTPYCEWDICAPKSVYGKTKLLGEEYVKEFCKKYFIVRTAWLYGTTGKNFVKTMLELGKTKKEIKVVNDQLGNPTNAADLAYNMLRILDTQNYGTYHCTGQGECSWYEFAKKIMEYSRLDCNVVPCQTKDFVREAPRPAFSSLKNLMLECSIGDKMRDWQEALKDFLSKV